MAANGRKIEISQLTVHQQPVRHARVAFSPA